MAIGGANISRGMNRGAAQVYDTSSPVNTYAKLLQQQQLKRDKETKLLQDELSKVSLEGIREADIPEFTTKYQEAKDIFGAKVGVKDQREKIKYDLEYNKKIQELKQIVDDSKNIAKNEQGFTNMLLNPNVRERYAEDAVTKFQNSKKLSRNDPNFIRDYTTFEHQVDASNTMKELADINKRLLAPIKSIIEQDPTRVGNMNGTFIRNVKRVPVEEQAVAFGMAMDVSPKLKAGILKLIPKNEGESDADYKSRALPLLVAQIPAEEYSDQVFRANQRPVSSKGDGGDGSASEPVNIDIPIGANTNRPGIVRVADYYKASIPKQNFAGSDYVDMDTGEKVKDFLPSSADYEIVGVGNFPIITSGKTNTGKSLVGSLAQPNFVENNPNAVEEVAMVHVQQPFGNKGLKRNLLVPYDRLPPSTKTNKLLSGFVPAKKKTKAPIAKETGSVATPKSFVYSATSGNNKVYSNDGKTWYTKDGKKIQ